MGSLAAGLGLMSLRLPSRGSMPIHKAHQHPKATAPARQALGSSSSTAAARSAVDGRPAVYIRHDIEPGSSVDSAGALAVLGDVAAGAALSAAGDIVVHGRLQGTAHAGRDGDIDARISALDMQNASVQIAGVHTQVSVHGAHMAYLSKSGTQLQLDLQPSLQILPSSGQVDTTSSFGQWKRYHPAAIAALFTGAYATAAGLALVLAPQYTLGLLFQSAQQLPEGWIQVGGVLFMLIGMQYFGTALGDWRAAQNKHSTHTTGSSSHASSGVTDESATVPSCSSRGDAHTAASVASTSFYVASVWSRAFLVAAFTVLVVLGHCERGLLVLAGINALGAAAMWRALRRQQQMQQSNHRKDLAIG